MKQHLHAGFVISRSTRYMFLKPVSRRETSEDRMQTQPPYSCSSYCSWRQWKQTKIGYFSLFITTFKFVDSSVCHPKAVLTLMLWNWEWTAALTLHWQFCASAATFPIACAAAASLVQEQGGSIAVSQQCLCTGCQAGDTARPTARSCPKLSPLHMGKQIWHAKAQSMGLFAFQLLSPCLSQGGHLDIITSYVLVLFWQELQAILIEIKDLDNLQKEEWRHL